jgi:hypothetical protein
MPFRSRVVLALCAMALLARPSAAQDTREAAPAPDPRAQYPALLQDSFISLNVGAIDYAFSAAQLEPGHTAASVTVPHVAVRAVLFGHELGRHWLAQASYMRPVEYVTYNEADGFPSGRHVFMHFGTVTLGYRADLTSHWGVYGEGGLAIVSRHGFLLNDAPVVRDDHFSSVLVGGGVDYRVNDRWALVGGVSAIPGRADRAEPRTLYTSAGFRYTMRALPPDRVEANRSGGVVFPVNLVQVEYSTGVGYGVNNFVSKTVPVFWGGNVQVDGGLALHVERNVFHSRRLFGLDVGASVGGWHSRRDGQRFYTLSAYPLFRFTFLHTRAADVHAFYSLAGPSYISQIEIDGLDTGRHFTFQDFMGIGAFVGRDRRVNLGVKINHYSNGNIFTENAGVKIPLTFTLGYTFGRAGN